jgi:hypothetical protein
LKSNTLKMGILRIWIGSSLAPPPHAQHYWVWSMDINGWPDSGNLISNNPTDLGKAMIPSYNFDCV